MNGKQRLAVLVMDVMLVIELAICMYLGQYRAEDLTGFFMKTYLPAAAITVVLTWLLIRLWRDDLPDRAPTAGQDRA